eukprot:gene24794-33274_t
MGPFQLQRPLHAITRSMDAIGRVSLTRSLSSNQDLDNSVIITKSCSQRIQALRLKAGKDNLRLRVSVEGGGCSGFKYTFQMEEDLQTATVTSASEDSLFERDGAAVVVDGDSLQLIRGATVDFQQDLARSSFAVVNNPQSESACGCGSSFAAKNFAANPAVD